MQNLQKPEVRFGEWISEGWKMFTEQWKAWVINALVFLGIVGVPLMSVVIGFYIYLFTTLSAAANTPGTPPTLAGEAIFGFYVIFFAVWAFAMVASSFLMGGMHLSAIKQLQGGKVEVRDLFSGARYFFPVLGATLLTMILMSIGAMLCIVPGFLVAGCLFFTMPLIIHRQLGAIEAMKTSLEVAKQNIWKFALFAIVTQVIAQVGAYAFYVGLLATFPLLFTITAVAYRDTFGVEGARYFGQMAPPTPAGYAQPYGDVYQPHPSSQPVNYPMSFPEPMAGNAPLPAAEPPSSLNQPPAAVERAVTERFSIPAPEPQSSAPGAVVDEAPPSPPPAVKEPGVSTKTDEVTPAPKAVTCSQCQMKLPPTAVFCPRCGNRVGA